MIAPMLGKLMRWMGVLFVCGLVGAAAFGLTVVKDRIRVVIQPDEAAAGPDPLALLRDDVQVVARDLAELRSGFGANFERLGTALEERAEARHADVQALSRDVLALRQRVEAGNAELARWQVRLQAIEARLETLAAVAAAPVAPVVAAEGALPQAMPGESVAIPTAASEPVAVPAAEPAPAPQPSPPAAKAGGFLSFSVPGTAFRFDEVQDYVLAPELCRVGFDAKSTLHDFSGVTSKVAGKLTADLDDPAGAWRGEVVCDAGTLLTGVDGRDANMWDYLDAKNHPQIRFAITRFLPAPDGIDAKKQTVRGDVVGQMTIRGVTRELKMPVAIEVDASRRLVVKGQTPLKLSDYGVPVPSQLGVINMQDEVVVWVALRARVQAGGRK